MPAKKTKKQPPQHLYVGRKVITIVVLAASRKEAQVLLKQEGENYEVEEAADFCKTIAFEVGDEITSVKGLPSKLWSGKRPFGNVMLPKLKDDLGNETEEEDIYDDGLEITDILEKAAVKKSVKKKSKK